MRFSLAVSFSLKEISTVMTFSSSSSAALGDYGKDKLVRAPIRQLFAHSIAGR
jgi:hypothetical protein